MVNQLIQMAAFKGMQQKNFPLWTLLNAYNQQPDRMLEMQKAGFFPSEQGPITMNTQPQLPAQAGQPITVVDENGVSHTGTLHQPKSHDRQLASEVKSISNDVKELIKFNKQQHRRIQQLENSIAAATPVKNPTVTP